MYFYEFFEFVYLYMWYICIFCFVGKFIILNDGVIILKNLDIVYFVVKILVDIVKF